MGTNTENFEAQKVRSGVSKNYLEFGSLYTSMLNCFLATCNSKRRQSIGKFRFGSICVTCETRCQHESIHSIVKTESSSNRTFVVRHKSGNFCSQLLFNSQKNFRLCSHDKLVRYTDDLFKITMQHTDRMPLFSHYCTLF